MIKFTIFRLYFGFSGKYQIVILFLLFAVPVFVNEYNQKQALSQSDSQSGVELTIVDKEEDARVIFNGNTVVRTVSYYLLVDFGGSEVKIKCTASQYNAVNEMESAMFTVFYSKEDNSLIQLVPEW